MTYSIQQADIEVWLNTLQGRVTTMLQGTQEEENLLGILEFSKNPSITIPSIYRRSKDLTKDQWRMVANSGIECIIHDSIKFYVEPMLGRNAVKLNFCIELVQHNPQLTNLPAILRLVNNEYLELLNDPITNPYAELPNGEAFERSLLSATVYHHLRLERL